MDLALLADDPADPLELLGHPLVQLDDFVERIGDLAGDARPVEGQPHGEVTLLQGGQGRQQRCEVDPLADWLE